MCFASNTFQSWDFRGITEILRTALPDTSLAGGRFSADRIKPPVAVRNCPHGRAASRCCNNSCYCRHQATHRYSKPCEAARTAFSRSVFRCELGGSSRVVLGSHTRRLPSFLRPHVGFFF